MYPVLIFTSLLCVLFQFEPIQAWVVWDSNAIAEGQWWRILTGNFSHTNYSHLLMNLAGLWIISYLFQPSKKQLVLALHVISLVTGIALLFSSIQIYVGLSGTLHGLFGLFALREALNGRKSSWLLVLGLVAKIAWEQLVGPSSTTGELINARVAIEAHLAGALVGGFIAIVLYLTNKETDQS
ncbi:Rhomboid family GlyGly-CTERM serine protease [Vibrio crassostreae]|uniref:rhombosortase n=1 Tax=Vibrio crassostreae TaxID=246167 RepID=UPI001B30C49A|nr:Rhomboid family GlyGly-CTERM serine protease [Vibrio crassostreae]CAK1902024.1 Rhomboid family GlyGly-CTERM serine protease [Vibrio crassostreae]CAK1903945.1 Rhomboid family GlyGly-CTERM serine protease [Vibrio crassostreae]CAK1907495.1 Rhomboid family GlyGly-CTERM serine protease [Vibrio crassostreae]CAK1907680.1 Rhomboid family GlyGly-CTERM serine protease [Vibrio crassostreae]